MSGEAARLFVAVDAEIRGAVEGLRTVDRDVRDLAARKSPTITPRVDTRQATGALDGLKSRLSGLTEGGGLLGGLAGGAGLAVGAGAIAGVAVAVAGLASGMIGGAAQMERYRVGFEVLLGSAAAAQARLAELTEFAKRTPFELPQVVEASRTLEVFTQGALATGEGLRLVGDIAAGTGRPIGETAMWIGRLYDALKAGRPIGEAAMRLQEMGAMSGESRARIEALADGVARGAVGISDAWARTAGEFGRYSGMMGKQSETLDGKMSNLSDSWNQLLTRIGTVAVPVLKAGIDVAIAGLEALATAIAAPGKALNALLESVGLKEVEMEGRISRAALAAALTGRAARAALAEDRATARAALEEETAALAKGAAKGADRMAAAARTLYAPLRTELVAAVRQAAEIAKLAPGAMGAALRANRTAWIDALKSLNDALKTQMSRGVEVAYLLAALTGQSIKQGLASEDTSVRRQTEATVGIIMKRLAQLQGPAWVQAYNFGAGYVASVARGMQAAVPKSAAWVRGMMNPVRAVVPATLDPARSRQQGLNWILGLADGISTGVGGPVTSALERGVGGPVTSALERARAATEARLERMKQHFDNFKSYLAGWPRMSADGIIRALDQVLGELAKVWAQLSAGEKQGEIREAGAAIIRAEEVARMPAAVQGVYTEIDAFAADMARLIKALDAATTPSAREALLTRAANLQAEILRHEKAAERMLAQYEDIERLSGEIARLQADAAATTDPEQLAGTIARIAGLQAEIEAANRRIAELAGGVAAVPVPVADAVAEIAAGGAGAVASAPPRPAVNAAALAAAQPTATVVNATVNVTGPTLDPYGDFAQRLAAALIPGLQRELARQGINL